MQKLLRQRLCGILTSVLLIFSLAQPAGVTADQSGVVLTFDDTYIDQWYDYFSGGVGNDVKATFFVSHWHTLSAEQIRKLKWLESAGHEIGGHTYSHEGVAGSYNLDPANINAYLNEQIIPSLRNMRADGFNPVSFSYPSGERNRAYDAAVRRYFPYLRTTFTDENRELFQTDEIFHSETKRYEVLAGDGIDNSYNNPLAEINAAFLRAKTQNEIITLYAHRILPDASPDSSHNFAIPVSKLNAVIARAREIGLKFYTFRAAYVVGSHSSTGGGSGSSPVRYNGGAGSLDLVSLLSVLLLMGFWQRKCLTYSICHSLKNSLALNKKTVN